MMGLAFIAAKETPQTIDVRASLDRFGTGSATVSAKAMIFSNDGDSLTSKRGVYFSRCCFPTSSNAIRNAFSLCTVEMTLLARWGKHCFFSSSNASHESLDVLDI